MVNSQYMISVVIATKNRPESVRACVTSILHNTYHNFQLLVIDQSTNTLTQSTLASISDPRLTIRASQSGGKSTALNMGLPLLQGTIIAFTDDDCIVSKTWLQTITSIFKNHSQIAAVFGQTKPYKPQNHARMICPATVSITTPRVISNPCYHATNIGFGNNMAWRTIVLKQSGGFKSWLGPGSIGSAAEDAEFMLRLLSNGYKILTSPKPIVYHNKWLTQREARRLNLAYSRGEMACYGYFSCQKYAFAKRLTKKAVRSNLHCLKTSLRLLLRSNRNKKTFGALYWSLLMLWNQTAGFAIGWYFSIITRDHKTA